MLVELGNDLPQDQQFPTVVTLTIPEGNMGRPIGIDRLPDESDEAFERRDAEHVAAHEGDALYSMPDEHDDDIFAQHDKTRSIAEALAGIAPDSRVAARRLLIAGHFAAGGSLPDHAAFTAVAHPAGFWDHVAGPGQTPGFVSVPDHPGLEQMLAEHYGCPAGKPDRVEDLYLTRHGASLFPPGAAPDPLSGFTMGHTTHGRVQQAISMFGFGPATLMGVGTASATSATTLTGSSETNPSRAANEVAGCMIVVSANAGGTGSKVYGIIASHTSGLTPVYTVDRWYNEASPGGAAGTTPNATSFYSIVSGPPTMFVGLSTDATAFSLGGTGGTQDAATIAQLVTGELTTVGGGLTRKIAPIGNSGASVTLTPVHTANGTDTLPQTIAKAVASVSFLGTGNGFADYMTVYSSTATLSAIGDQLTSTWTMTET